MNQENAASTLVGIFIFLVLIGIVGGLMFGVPNYTRYQRLADERNQVTVNDIQIQQTEQLVKVQQQKAQVAIEEAKGIAESQSIINNTLTPLYIQHEAIQAQKDMANGQNHTVIYIPSGNNGVPVVTTVPQQ